MGNTATIRSRRNSTSTGNNVRRVHWGGSGLPGPPGKPILIPSYTEDSQPIIVGIRWERSLSNGGSPIIGYLVEHRRVGSPHWVRSSPGLCSYPELTLTGLEPGWRYQFRVRAQNTVGLSATSEVSDPLTVTLQRAEAAAPYFISELRNTTALENEQVEFIVHFFGTPIPKISWFKDDFEIFSSRRTKIITENGRSSLVIHQTALNDEGEIKCTAANKAGHVSTRGKLVLQALPKIRLPRQYEDGLLFEKGETIKLKIFVAGRPSPSVTWYHDGEVISVDDRHIMESIDTGDHFLTVVAAVRKDRGEYTIKAANELGEDGSSFLVTVTDRPAAPGTIKIMMTLGRSVTLSWDEPEDDGGCKIGTYIVEYYRIGWNVWLKANTSRRPETTLVDLIGDSEYKFRVKAENPYGVSDPSKESDVIFITQTRGSSSKSTPSLAQVEKYQEEQQNYRGRRLEKYNEDIPKSTKRTRSLTREEAADNHELSSRSVSVQRLSSDTALTKSSRSDSRVTFADTVCLHVEKPLEDSPVPRAKPRSKRDKSLKINYERTTDITVLEGTMPGSNNSLIPDHSNSSGKGISSLLEIASSSTIPQTNDDDLRNANEYHQERNNEEFMLILYPNTDAEDLEKKYTSEIDSNIESDDDLLPPPMSRSLPELFSVDHHIVPVVREAFSSTELLHERALERFHRAIAMEEANDTRKESSHSDNLKYRDLGLSQLRNMYPQRKPSAPAASRGGIQTTLSERRSSDGQTVCITTHRVSESLLQELPMIASDPNLGDFNLKNESHNNIRQSLSETVTSLRRWDDGNLFSASQLESSELEEISSSNARNLEDDFAQEEFVLNRERLFSNEASVLEYMEDEESENSEDTSDLRSKEFMVDNRHIVYHPSKVDTSHDKSVKNSTTGLSTVQPKSILKKRADEVSVPLNSFGRAVPVEMSVRPIGPLEFSDGTATDNPQSEQSNTIGNSKSMLNISDNMRLPVTSDTESDNASLMIAAEVAQNRRKLSAKSLTARRSSTECKEDVEAQRAVIDHYTEIVKAHSMNFSVFPPRQQRSQSVSRNSRPTSPIRISSEENLVEPKKSTGNDLRNPKNTINQTGDTIPSPNQFSKVPMSQKKQNERKTSLTSANSSIGGSIPSRSSRIDRGRSSRESSTSRSSSKTRKRRGHSSFDKIRTERKKSEDSSAAMNPNETRNQGKPELSGRIGMRDTNAMEEPSIIQTQIKVQSMMSYSIDLILFIGAVYIYLFKKEIFAIPLIGLVLYRRIQADVTKWIPH